MKDKINPKSKIFNFRQTYQNIIIKLLKGLITSKAPGPDNISTSMIIDASNEKFQQKMF